MNILDICIIALLALLIWVGSVQRPIRQLSMSLGVITGLVGGSIVYNRLAYMAADSKIRTIILGLLLLAAGFICYDIMRTIGSRVEQKLHADHPVKSARVRQRFISAGIGGVGGIFIIWLIAGMFSSIPLPVVERQFSQSLLLSSARQNIALPGFFQTTANLLSPFSSPQTFISEPTFNDDVAVSQNFSSLDTAVEKASASVLKVNAWGCGVTSTATSFIVDKQAVITSAHVVAGADRISVQDNGANYTAQVIWLDKDADVAVLSVSQPLSPSPLTIQTKKLGSGSLASVIGYPGGGSRTNKDAIVLESITAKGYDIYNTDVVNRDVYVLRTEIVPGNSGGPVIDTSGKVIGLVIGHSTTQAHTGYALMAHTMANDVAKALENKTVVSSGACAS